jgi:type I restriction enzyme S subunit
MSSTRYPAYKDSGVAWIGLVPAHWEVKQLKTLTATVKGFVDGDWIESKDISEDGIRYLTSGNVGLGHYKEQGSGYISEQTFKELACTEVLPNDILISRLNLPIGRACLVPDLGQKLVTCVDNVIFRPAESNCREYLVYLLVSHPSIENLGTLSSGTTMLRISRSTLGHVRYALPPFAEQQAIAAFLDGECARIDALVAAQQRMIALLKEKRQALISQAVTRGLDPAVLLRDSGVAWLGQVPAHWEVKRLKFNAEIIPSNVDKKSYDDELSVSLCNYTDVYYNDIILADMEFMQATATFEQVQKYSLIAGDIIITKDSESADDIAIPAFVPQTLPNVVCGYHLSIIRTGSILDGKYAFHYFLSTQAKSYFETRANGLTRVGLGQAAIGNLPTPLPPLAEQQAIAAFLDRECARFDALIRAAERAVVLLQERRSAVIAAAVTGQIRVG